MKLPLDWLKAFVNINESPDKVGDKFYNLGFGLDGIKDDVLDLEVTPNRGDCQSVFGLAREYASLTKQQLLFDPYKLSIDSENKDLIKVKLNSELVEQYAGLVIQNIEVKESPTWLINRLKDFEINSINNIVDITNYIMIELGIPLHAFDLDAINHQLLITNANDDDKITTLNGKEYVLKNKMIIAKSEIRIVDLVAIQGGLDSGVTEKTTNIYLQGIIPNSINIRQTSKALKLSTDASYRFERGVDPALLIPAIARAAEMVVDQSGGETADFIDLTKPVLTKHVKFDLKDIEKVSGTEISDETAIGILTRLGFIYQNNQIFVPSWRTNDINYSEDIVEEVIRVIGYNNLKQSILPAGKSNSLPTNNEWLSERNLSQKLINNGFSEILTYSFISNKEGGEEYVEVANPLSEEHTYMRKSLIPMLIKAGEQNTWYPDIKLFEIGHVYLSNQEITKVGIIASRKIDYLPNAELINEQKLRRKYYVWEGSVSELATFLPNESPKYSFPLKTYRNISKYPPVTRDLALIVDSNLSVTDVRDAILELDEKILLCELFDEYESDKLGERNKSLAFHIVFDDIDKTLNSSEIDVLMERIITKLKSDFGATIR